MRFGVGRRRKRRPASPMEKRFTLLHTVATSAVFSTVSFWYGFMFGRESARKELGEVIDELRKGSPSAATSENES